jgi:hypothetical protein
MEYQKCTKFIEKWKKINTQKCNCVETFVEFMKEGNVLPSVK